MDYNMWPTDYNFFLTSLQLPSLSSRRSMPKLLLMYKIRNKLVYFPPNLIQSSSGPSRRYHSTNLSVPFCQLSSYQSPFIPSTIKLFGTPFLLILSYSLHLALLSKLLGN